MRFGGFDFHGGPEVRNSWVPEVHGDLEIGRLGRPTMARRLRGSGGGEVGGSGGQRRLGSAVVQGGCVLVWVDVCVWGMSRINM